MNKEQLKKILDLKSKVTENVLGMFNSRCEMAKTNKKISKFNTPNFMKTINLQIQATQKTPGRIIAKGS